MLSIRASWFRFAGMMMVACGMAAVVSPARATFDVFSVGGSTSAASVTPTLDSFRAALGGANNGTAAGPIVGGRREINWDGGGATTSTSSSTPLTTFQNRGATFTTPGTGFLQTPENDPALTGINASYSTAFAPFSQERFFTPVGSNITDVEFNLPGFPGTPATVSGFGAVFSDVDTPNTTKIELFDLLNASLGVFNVPSGSTTAGPSYSFLGLIANAGEQIARVRITTGTGALGPADQNGDPNDLVVIDDLIYAEPVGVPEPHSAVLLLLASGASSLEVRRRRK